MACIEYPLCKYAHYEDGSLICHTGEPCGYQRYCSTLLKVIHTSAYKNCKEVMEMAKKKKIEGIKEENLTLSNDFIEKKEKCKVRYSDGFIYINFKGFGLMLPNIEKHNEPELMVYYEGEIGKANFKFRI